MSCWTPGHEDFRQTVRRFVEREILPNVNDWEEQSEAGQFFPRELYRQAADIGLLAIGYPEALGGIVADHLYRVIVTEEVARAGSGGLLASLLSHGIGLPPIVAQGSSALQQRIVPEVLAGRKIAALAITEPGGGSDVGMGIAEGADERGRGAGDADVVEFDPARAQVGERRVVDDGPQPPEIHTPIMNKGCDRDPLAGPVTQNFSSGEIVSEAKEMVAHWSP